MTVPPGDVGGPPDDDPHSPLLPPDDRLWRHPSEVGATHPTLPLDQVAVRRRWLLSHPSRRSALTAGVVGALLATGVVALGTHLADSMEGAGRAQPGVTTGALSATSGAYELSPTLEANIVRVSEAMVFVDTTRGTTRARVLGLVVRSDGMILVPAGGITGAASLLVTLADGDLYVGYLVASDPNSGLAIVRINGATGLATATLSVDPMSKGSFALALTKPGGTAFSLGTVRTLDSAPRVDGYRLVGAITTDLAPSSDPPGSPLLGPTGLVEGVVTGSTKAGVVVAPSWLVACVANELMTTGKVNHGWLGLSAATHTGKPAGVLVKSVTARGAAARAGIRAGDVIVALDGSPVSSLAELQAQLYVLRPGTRVSVGVVHGMARSTHSAILLATPNH